MSGLRALPTEAPPPYRYVTRFYGRSLRPVVAAISLITSIWALAWTVLSFKVLQVDESDHFPKLAPLAIAQGVMYAVACAFEIVGLVGAAMQRLFLIKIYAFLCALSTLLVIGVGFMRVITHFVYKSDLISECTIVAQSGSTDWVFGMWASESTTTLTASEAVQYCNDQWSHDSWAEIVMLLVEIVLGILFTAIAFAYYRQSLDPASVVNSSRLPSNQVRRDGYPTSYNPPYDDTAYAPMYLPPPGSPPTDSKPPEYKRSIYPMYGGDKDVKDDPFSDYDGPSVPMPTHWVEDRDERSSPRA